MNLNKAEKRVLQFVQADAALRAAFKVALNPSAGIRCPAQPGTKLKPLRAKMRMRKDEATMKGWWTKAWPVRKRTSPARLEVAGSDL